MAAPNLGPRSLTLAGDLGYALTEAQAPDDGTHHRLLGTFSVGVTPLSWLGIALRLDGRYDRHPKDAHGVDTGWMGVPRLALRAGHALGSGWALGADVDVAFPSGEAPSFDANAITTELAALVSWSAATVPLSVLGRFGYRIDRSAHSIDQPDQLRRGDRIALGVSEFDAVLVGLGVLYRPDPLELFVEATADLWVGSGAPSLDRAPLRVTAGGRYAITDDLVLAATVEVVPSARPRLDQLVPIEPRFTSTLGLRYTWGFDPAEPPAGDADEKAAPKPEPEEEAEEEPKEEPEPEEESEPAPPPGELRGVIRTFGGEPLEAKIRVEPGDSTTQADADGYFQIELPPGKYTVHIEAPGYRSQSRPLSVDEQGVTVINVELREGRGRR
ncbi:MAG: carboxypeptidase-like regulatory domain-containing protein [Myxococcota bacterium]